MDEFAILVGSMATFCITSFAAESNCSNDPDGPDFDIVNTLSPTDNTSVSLGNHL